MTDSKTRREWEQRITAIMNCGANLEGESFGDVVDGWVDEIMAIPALRLAEKAEENPDYRLAVVDTQHGIGFQEEADYLRIIALEAR